MGGKPRGARCTVFIPWPHAPPQGQGSQLNIALQSQKLLPPTVGPPTQPLSPSFQRDLVPEDALGAELSCGLSGSAGIGRRDVCSSCPSIAILEVQT